MQTRSFALAGMLLIISGIIFGTTFQFSKTEITFKGTAAISGIVTDESGKTIAGVAISFEGSTFGTATDSTGYFEIKNLESGTYKMLFSFAGYENMKETIAIKESEQKKLSISLKKQSEQAELSNDEEKNSYTKRESVKSVNASTGYFANELLYAPSIKDDDKFYQEHNTESYQAIQESGFKKVVGNPLSTFSIDVDNASYSNIRRFITYGQTPPKDAVRIEEMINYFDYNYQTPIGTDPFAMNMEMGDCPWNTETKLIMIGLQGKELDLNRAEASNLVFLIDVSGSMAGENRLPLVKKSLNMLIDGLSEKDRVSIVVYAGAAGLVLPSTSASDKTKIKEAIQKLEAGGSTAGGEGIHLAYKIASENFIEDGNNRVILCTDGDFNVGVSSDAEMTRLIEEKRTSGVFITVCGFGMGNYKDSKMEQIADNGNGTYYYIDNEQEAKKIFITDLRGTLFTIAKDVKIQVEFNPAKVEEYRLIGYENRMLNKEDFDNDKKDAGELGAGHKVTALYEVKLKKVKSYSPSEINTETIKDAEELKYQTTTVMQSAYLSDDILTIKMRYKLPKSDVSKLIEKSISGQSITLENTSDNFRFASAVAEFGMLLRDSEFKGNSSFEQAIKLAQGAKGTDQFGYRAEFVSLVQSYLGFAQK